MAMIEIPEDQWDELKADNERLRKVNDKLHRRVQKVEGLIEKGYHGTAFNELMEQEIAWKVRCRLDNDKEVKKWMFIAQKHGENNAKLKREIIKLKKQLGQTVWERT